MTERAAELVRQLEEAQREVAYYRRIAEEAGVRRLREAEALSALLERAQRAERDLQRARDELERRVDERTRELTIANAHLSEVVAERERAERALRASEESFRSFMAHLPGLAYVKEADTTIVFASEGFRTHLGLDPATLVGKTNTDALPEPFASKITADDLRVLTSARAERIEEEFGGRIWATQKFVIPRADGAPRLGGVTLDVTESKRAEQERLRLERQVEQAQRLESLGVLAGGIAHDFNNLLATILANVAVLRADGPGADPECLADVEAAARAAAGLCQQMLAYAGRGAVATEALDVSDLVRRMVSLLRSSVSRKIGLELELAPGLPPVRGDASQLRQVVLNLVINAAEAVGDHDGTITVSAFAADVGAERLGAALLGEGRAPGAHVVLEVEDTGCGMDPETQRRIFEPFFSSKFAGRGLGLSAVLGVVRQLAGAIEVESAPGRGSRFRVLLPAAAGAPAADRPESAAARWSGSGLVLVVDDDPAVRRAAARLLRRDGLDVLEARDGAEGVEVYRRHRGAIGAILLDLTMPHQDGVETLRALRDVDPDAFVVVVSGHAQDDVVARFRAAPPDGFLRKPFEPDALREQVRRGFEPRRRGEG